MKRSEKVARCARLCVQDLIWLYTALVQSHELLRSSHCKSPFIWYTNMSENRYEKGAVQGENLKTIDGLCAAMIDAYVQRHAPRNKRSFKDTDYSNLNWIYLDLIWWFEPKFYKKILNVSTEINNVIQNKNNIIESFKHNIK